MGTSNPTLDPRIEEVLRGIAAGASSGLLAVDPRKLVTGLSAERFQVGVAQAGLTSAERELLGAHREEVARLLLDAYIVRLVGNPRARVMYPHRRLGREEWSSRAHGAAHAFNEPERGNTQMQSAQALLESCVTEASSHGGSDTSALLFTSLRLVDRPGTRVWLANDAFSRGEIRSALRIAEGVINGRCRPAVAHTAWQVAGKCLELLHGMEHARAAYCRAIELCEQERITGAELAIPVMNAFMFALSAGSRADAVEHARQLDDCVTSSDDVVRRQVAILHGARAAGMQVPSEARRIADGLDVRDDGAVKEVVDALV